MSIFNKKKTEKKSASFAEANNLDKVTVGMALMNVLHLCRDQSSYSLSVEEIAGIMEGVLDKAEVQALINSLLKSLKR